MRSYCPPTIFETGGRTQMVLSGNICVASYDPATGKLWWILDGPTDQMVASVVLTRDVFFVTGGFPELHILGLPTDRTGKLTEDDILWRSNEGVSYVPSPIAHEDHFFVVSDKGIASCFEAKTGEVLWKRRMGGRHSASLVKAEGRIYFLSDDGECWVVKAGPEYEEISVNRLGEPCNASPAISRGQIFIRTDRHLFAIGEPKLD
jgi:outer membrane protein assembly factor BamB